MAPAKKEFRVEAVLPCAAAHYFLERDSAAFRSLLSKALKIGQLEFKEMWREGGSSFVRIVTKPEFGSWVPRGVAGQLQSSNLEFHDIIEYNPAHIAAPGPYKVFVRTESPFLKDKLDIMLTLTIEDVEPGVSCRQVLEGHIRVKMGFGVGRIVEGIVKDSLHNTYKQLPEIVRRWQLFREEALRSGDGRQLLLGRPPVGCEVHWIRQEVLQTLKEPLPGVGGALSSPVSALSPAAGASEASEGSAAAAVALVEQLQREQQQEGAAAAVGQVGEEQLPRRAVSAAMSVHSQSQYYDAPEAPEEEPGRRQQLAGGADLPPAGSAAGSSTPALAAAALARGAHHRRAVSGESATSTDTPPTEDSAGQGRHPVSRRFWRRFNRDMGEWDTFWDKVGVEQEDGEERPGGGGGGVVSRALHSLEDVLKAGYYSTTIMLALFLVRNGWLRVQPDADADPHEGRRSRQHSGGSAEGGEETALPRPQSLARVAQEVRSRMVTGSRAVAAAGTSVRQASVSGAKAIFAPGRPRSTSGSDSGRGGQGRSMDGEQGGWEALPPGLLPGAAASLEVADMRPSRHGKTMSLDAGTAAAARQAAAAALVQQQQHQQQGEGSPGKAGMERRPSNMAAVAAMASMQREEGRVRVPARLGCFTLCRRPPAVKD